VSLAITIEGGSGFYGVEARTNDLTPLVTEPANVIACTVTTKVFEVSAVEKEVICSLLVLGETD
jgi:hypothetical protein